MKMANPRFRLLLLALACWATSAQARPPGLEPLPGQTDQSVKEEEEASPDGAKSRKHKSEESGSNPIFAYTHLLSSPLTLPGGRLVIGTQVAYGILGFFQAGTDLVRDIYQVYNVGAKLKVVDTPSFTLAATAEYETFNYNTIAPTNPSLQVTSWLPGLVAGIEVLPQVAWFVGGNLNILSQNLITSGVQTSGYVHGSQVESDLSWMFLPGFAIATGLTYDLTYRVVGYGVSTYLKTIKLGVHYYANADQYRVMPILAGGVALDF